MAINSDLPPQHVRAQTIEITGMETRQRGRFSAQGRIQPGTRRARRCLDRGLIRPGILQVVLWTFSPFRSAWIWLPLSITAPHSTRAFRGSCACPG